MLRLFLPQDVAETMSVPEPAGLGLGAPVRNKSHPERRHAARPGS
jgi:hypothetical protein